MGLELKRVQIGLNPNDWKPMPSVGAGVREIRVHAEGEFRTLYVADRSDAVYVLHAFQKKSQKTSTRDIELGRRRLKDIGDIR